MVVKSFVQVKLPADPGAALEAATEQYVDNNFQPVDADLTAIAAISPSNDDVIQRKAGAWTNRTMSQLKTDLAITASDVGAQPVDSDLTTIAGLTATTDNMIQSVGSAWASRTPAQVKAALAIAESDVTNLVTDLAAKQPLDSDLTTIAGLTATTDNFLQAKASAWASRTPTQVAADLVTPLSSSFQPLDSDLTTIAGLTPTTDNFMVAASSAWASRTPAQAKTSLALVKGDVGLGSVDNTSDATKNSATATLTNKRITKRIGTTASSSTPTADADNHDAYTVTAAAVNMTVGAPTGTPTEFQPLVFRFKDNGTARTIGWNAVFRAVGVTLPTTTVAGKTLYVGCWYNGADSVWDVTAVGQQA